MRSYGGAKKGTIMPNERGPEEGFDKFERRGSASFIEPEKPTKSDGSNPTIPKAMQKNPKPKSDGSS